MRLVGRDWGSCGSVCAPWAAGRAFWGPVAAGRASPQMGGRQPLGECWVFQDLEVPYFHGKSWGLFSRSHLSHPMFSHLCFCCTTE